MSEGTEEAIEALILQITDVIIGFDSLTATAALTCLFNIGQRTAVGKGKWREWIKARDVGYAIFEASYLPLIEKGEG